MNQENRFSYPDKLRITEITRKLPGQAYCPAPSPGDREFWQGLGRLAGSDSIIAQATGVLDQPVPRLTDDDYLDYSRTGSRNAHSQAFTRCKHNLQNLVLAECLENDGRFLRLIEAYITAFLSMKTWVAPPHDSELNNFYGRKIEVDLLAAATSNLLATIHSLLGNELSPGLSNQLELECRRRVINPYLHACRHGLTGNGSTGRGFGWITVEHNWNAVCHFGVVYTALIMAPDLETRAEIIACALTGLPYYIQGFSDDGYCSEGIGYWNYGFGSYLALAEVLQRHTEGRIDLLGSGKLRKIAEFPFHFALTDNIFPAFSDNSVAASVGLHTRLAVARNFDLPSPIDKVNLAEGSLEQIMLSLTATREVGVGQFKPGLRSWFDRGEVLVCRPRKRPDSFYAAIKSGHNLEQHNHNDVGSYLVLFNDLQPNCDPGREIYTSRTFSSKRYQSCLLNSWGHPVPLVGGRGQGFGRQFHGSVVNHSFSEGRDLILIDLKPAYDLPSLVSLERAFVFDRLNNRVEVSDSVEFKLKQAFGTALVTYEEFKIVDNRFIYIHDSESCVKVVVEACGGDFSVRAEQINEDNGSVDKPWRLGIDFSQPITTGVITLRFEPSSLPENRDKTG